ncbi:MAG: glycosyltransferase [Actinomycetota bacterium]|nr:glycosyltransferase [Actinomycetota bacterium]
MGYRIVEVDVRRPLSEVSFGPDDGVGLLLRDGTRPVGFLLLPRAGSQIPAPELEALVVSCSAEGLLRERIRAALVARDQPALPSADFGVTVTVCTRNRPEDLERCLDSIEAATSRFPGHTEILVVDNAPPDGRTREVVERRPAVRYATEPVAGLDVARNRALAEAGGDWIAFVDDDVRVDVDWLLGLAAARAEHPGAAAVTGLVLPAELQTDAQIRFERRGGFGRGYEQRRWDGRHGPGGRLHPLGAGVFGAGCNMAYDLAVLRSLGGFDEALDTGPPLPGGGDLDGFFKVLAAGHALVYEPRMAVFHRHRRGLDELRRQYGSWGSGFAAFLGARWRDPDERAQIVRLVVWWLGYQQREVRRAVRRGDAVDVRMTLAELAGGVGGALGGYTRSRRRMASRRAARPAQATR